MPGDERPNHSGLRAGVHFDMEAAGTELRIPREEWDNPAIHELVGFIQRAEELWSDLYDAAADASGEAPPRFLDGAHTLYERYHAAENLVRVMNAQLREGLGIWETRQEPGSRYLHYLQEKLENALRDYGLSITTDD